MTLLKPFFLLWAVCAASVLSAQPARPVIAHEPPASVVAGQPLRIVARVSSRETLQSVTVHVAQSGGAAPTVVPMQSAGAGVYAATLNPDLFSAADSFRYYLDARGESGVFTETNWMTVQVIGRGAKTPAEEAGWQRPVLIGAGAAVAVGAGVALASSGGGGGGGDGDAGGGDVDPADQVIVRTASDRVDESSPTLPKSDFVDVADELAGRRITRVRIRMEFNGEDGGVDVWETLYNGSVALSGATGGTQTRQVDLVGTSATQVEIRINSSESVGGVSAYSWTVTVTYFVE